MKEMDKKIKKNMMTMTLMDEFPNDNLIQDVKLRFLAMSQQTLSSRLSWWLVIYDFIR